MEYKNYYFKDDGKRPHPGFMSGMVLPIVDGKVENCRFVECEFHWCCKNVVFENCEFIDCSRPWLYV